MEINSCFHDSQKNYCFCNQTCLKCANESSKPLTVVGLESKIKSKRCSEYFYPIYNFENTENLIEFQKKRLNNQRNKDNFIEMFPRVCFRLSKTSSNKYGLTIKFNDLMKTQQSSLFHESRFNLRLFSLKDINCDEKYSFNNEYFNIKIDKIIKEQISISLVNNVAIDLNTIDKAYMLEVRI